MNRVIRPGSEDGKKRDMQIFNVRDLIYNVR